LNSGIVYNAQGNDMMIHSDGDFDGDLIMTTDQPEFISGAKGGLPVTYTKNKVGKKNIIESELYQPDMLAFNSRVGYITNCSTTMYAMLPLYHKESREYKEIINRLKICRKEQGNEIDKAKGLIVKQFPKHWTRYTKKGKKISDEDADFYNSIMVNKRPYFMRWLYSNYSKKYKLFIDNYNKYGHVMLGRSLLDILKNTETNDEVEFISKYNRFIPLLETDCLMNEICRHMESQIKELKENVDKEYDLNIIKDILQNKQFRGSKIYKEKYKKFMEKIYEEYKINKCRFSDMTDEKGDQKFKTLEQFNKYLRLEAIKEISSDLSELATLAVDASYTMKGDKSFAWNVFGEGIIENVMDNKQDVVSIPFLDKNGEILYLDSKYSLFDIDFSSKELDIDDYL
jgi:alpha-galactosidase/6-phospho-beta-glucosidase family protein